MFNTIPYFQNANLLSCFSIFSPLGTIAQKSATTIKKHPIKTAIAVALIAAGIMYFHYSQERSPLDLCSLIPKMCEGNLGIPRKNMPQLDGETLDRFLKKYKDILSVKNISSQKLLASQKEINLNRIIDMLKDKDYDPCKETILTALGKNNETQVIDGHHRAFACRLLDGSIRAYHLEIPIQKALKIALEFPGSNRFNL